jgi:tRNA(Ile2) C34 agmatinyltransferase TiaS
MSNCLIKRPLPANRRAVCTRCGRKLCRSAWIASTGSGTFRCRRCAVARARELGYAEAWIAARLGAGALARMGGGS